VGRDPRHDVLFESLSIGPKTLRNRFYQVPHSTGFGSDRPGAQARFRSMAAEGGWAAVCVELTSIAPESDRASLPVPVRLWDDDDASNLAFVCDEAHRHGALAGVELWHGGVNVDRVPGREAPVAPSQLPSNLFAMTTPRELDFDDIVRVQDAYVAAALRARDAGFDIVYVYGAHGYLPVQFLSPFSNRRTDAYGGSLENRARFWLEALEKVRAAVGGDCAVAVRVGVDPEGIVGAGIDDVVSFVRLAEDLVDLWDVNTSTISQPWLDMRPSRLAPQGYQREWQRQVKAATSKPVVGVSRFTNPDVMAEAIRRGDLDAIGAARPVIADPFLPRKVDEGRLDEIRECIGCNVCISQITSALPITCTQNAVAGEEFRRGWHPERFDRAANADLPVLVVGAGVAGLECARVLGERGFESVEVVDAAAEAGGYALRASTLPGLGEWRRLVDYRLAAIERLPGVEPRTGARLGVAEVLDYGAAIVVVATGASWSRNGVSPATHEPLPGADLPHVLVPEEVLAGADVGETVAVVDCEGYFMGVGLAEALALRGASVSLVTPFAPAAPFLDRTLEGAPVRARLHTLGVDLRTETQATAIQPGALDATRYGAETTISAETVVLVTSRKSEDALLRALRDRIADASAGNISAVYGIGDCIAPRLLSDCVFDGHRLAREIDGTDPSRPLPFARERRLARTTPDDTCLPTPAARAS